MDDSGWQTSEEFITAAQDGRSIPSNDETSNGSVPGLTQVRFQPSRAGRPPLRSLSYDSIARNHSPLKHPPQPPIQAMQTHACVAA